MTIKTQGGKVITKDGKVSCECCGACCFYPSQSLFDGDYEIADLPDSIEVQFAGAGSGIDGTYVISKNDPPISDYRGFPVYYGDPSQAYVFLTADINETASWFVSFNAAVETDFECLIFPQSSTSIFSRDLFAQSYSINGQAATRTPSAEFDGRIYYSCTWLGESFVLRYSSLLDKDGNASGLYKWTVNGNPKIGNQNTPVGSYEGGFSVS
jgi:hypothetical protein